MVKYLSFCLAYSETAASVLLAAVVLLHFRRMNLSRQLLAAFFVIYAAINIFASLLGFMGINNLIFFDFIPLVQILLLLTSFVFLAKSKGWAYSIIGMQGFLLVGWVWAFWLHPTFVQGLISPLVDLSIMACSFRLLARFQNGQVAWRQSSLFWTGIGLLVFATSPATTYSTHWFVFSEDSATLFSLWGAHNVILMVSEGLLAKAFICR